MSSDNRKKLNLAPAPWHKTADQIRSLFTSKRIGDPLSDGGWLQIQATESYQDMFKKELLKGVPDLTGEHLETVESMIDNSFREVSNPFSAYVTGREGLDAMAPNANYNQFARLNPFTILGYIARSKVIDLYFTVNSDKPTITYEYNYEYILKGDDPTTYQMPQAIRDGTVSGILDLPSATPIVSGDAPHIESLTVGAVTSTWIQIGKTGNLLTESGHAPMKHSIERNVSIAKIRVLLPISGAGNPPPVEKIIDAYLDRDFVGGDQSQRVFNESYDVTWVDTGAANVVKKARITIIGVINLDSGEYSIAQAGGTYVTHFQFNAKVTNLANEMGTVRGGAKKFVETFDVNNKITGTVPISQLMADDFNLAGEGVTYTAYMVDKMTEAYAGFRDLELERELELAWAKPKENFRLFVKLGGYDNGNNVVPFVLSARGAGGGDAFQWTRDGLKDVIRHLLTEADVYTQFEASTPRSWMIYGAEKDIQRLPEISWTNYAGEGDEGAAQGNYRYGFAVDTAAGFADNFGRRVKVIGSKDKRRWNQPMIAQLKTQTLEQPTTVYFPYSFRVFSGISPEYGKLPALCIFQRDYIGTLSKAQVRVSLTGNDTGLYQRMATWSSGQAAIPGAGLTG